MSSDRRSFLRKMVTATGVVSLTNWSGEAAASSHNTWNMYQYDPRNSGYNPEAPGPSNGVQQNWTIETETGIYSSPAVTADSVYFLTAGGILYKVERDSGKGRWSTSIDTTYDGSYSNISSPAVHNNTVFVGSGDRRIYAISSSGEERWKKGTGGKISSSPTLSGESIFIGSEDGKLYRFGTDSGLKNWDFETGFPITATPAVSDSSVFVGCAESPYQENNFFSVEKETGEERWSFDAEGEIYTAAAVSANSVFVGDSSGVLYCLDKQAGQQRWMAELDGDVSKTLVLTDEFVCALSGSTVFALAKSDGTELWNYTMTDSYSYGRDIAASKRMVYAGDANGVVRGIRNGVVDWQFQGADSSFHSPPAVVNKTVYIGNNSGSLYSLSDTMEQTQQESPTNAGESASSTSVQPSDSQSTVSSGTERAPDSGQEASSDSRKSEQTLTSSTQSPGGILAGFLSNLSIWESILGIVASLLAILEIRRRKK